MLSNEQEDQITLLKEKIERIELKIKRLEDEFGGEDDDEIQSDIDELNGEIDDLNDEISDIESSPEGDYPEDKIEEAVDDRLEDVRRNPESYIEDWSLDYENFIDRRTFIQDVIDTDGYAHTLNRYDGNADEQKVQDQWFYVMRIN
jgi:chromosome segregation ATPase